MLLAVVVLRWFLFFVFKRQEKKERVWSKEKVQVRELKAAERVRVRPKQKMRKRLKVQVRRQSYLYAVECNTNVCLQVVHSFGLTVVSIVF